jgi:transposase
MANQLKMAVVQAILSLHAQGWSQRSIALRLGVHRETVSRHIRQATSESKPATLPAGLAVAGDGSEVPKPAILHGPSGMGDATAGGSVGADPTADAKPATLHTGKLGEVESLSPLPSKPRSARPASQSHCEPWRAQIEAKRAQGLTAQRIYQDLSGEQGFTWSYSTVQRFVRRLEQTRPLPFRRLECRPGEEAQVDFGTAAPIVTAEGQRRRPHVFRIVLSYSRKAYSEVVERQTTEVFIRCLENAFAHFGGVPQTLVIDNLRAAVSKADWYEPELHPKLQAFAAHYGVVILPTKPYTPRHKGKIERGVGYVKGNALQGHTFTSVAEQNRHLRGWEENVADCRIHGTTRRQVGQVFRELEQPALRPLPVERFPLFHEAQRIVHRDGHVSVERAYYSVPPEYLGRTVWVRWDAGLVRIFNEQMKQIAVHARREPGRFSTQTAHVAAEKTSSIERGAAWLLGRARLIGPQTGQWAAAMLEARGIQGLRVLQGLIALAGKHDTQALEAACETASSYGAYHLRTVRELVKRQAAKQQPLEFTAEHPLIRDLADYGAVARRAWEQTVRTASGGRDHQDPKVPSPAPPSSFPSSLLPLNPWETSS